MMLTLGIICSMSGTSSFTTTIPAQPNGTIVAYYISLTDNYGNESGVTPVAANLAPLTMPIYLTLFW